MSGYTEDVETYRRLCKYYKVPIRYRDDGIEDLYGHGYELYTWLTQERAGKPWRQIEEWETFDNNKDMVQANGKD